MIYDHISNSNRYPDPAIQKGLEIIHQIIQKYAQGEPLNEGSYPLENGLRYNIDRYRSKTENTVGYEAHRQYIDIQFLLEGTEMIRVHNLEGMHCMAPYDASRDAGFYLPNDDFHTDIRIGDGYFTILYPNDAHMPQLCIETPMPVLKIVVKVPVERTFAQ